MFRNQSFSTFIYFFRNLTFPNLCIIFRVTVDVELLSFPINFPPKGSHPSNPFLIIIGGVVLVSEEYLFEAYPSGHQVNVINV